MEGIHYPPLLGRVRIASSLPWAQQSPVAGVHRRTYLQDAWGNPARSVSAASETLRGHSRFHNPPILAWLIREAASWQADYQHALDESANSRIEIFHVQSFPRDGFAIEAGAKFSSWQNLCGTILIEVAAGSDIRDLAARDEPIVKERKKCTS